MLLPLRIVAISFALAALLSSGCCLTRPCGVVGRHYGAAGCGAAACGECSDSPVIPCRNGCGPRPCLLGLRCIGKIFSIAHYGCTDCGSGIGGCGETYYHDWINDPPCNDPCDGCGHWTPGGAACSTCADDPVVGTVIEPACGVAAPTCGAAGGCLGTCGGICGYGGRTAFQIPGRLLYKTWLGLGGVVRGVRCGFLPACSHCNAFSLSDTCSSCMVSTTPDCSCAGATSSGCSTCGVASTSVVGDGIGWANNDYPGMPHQVVSNHRANSHRVVSNQMRVAHGRPPHKVVSDRLR